MTVAGPRAFLRACLVSLVLLQIAQAFYLPGVAPQDFAKVLLLYCTAFPYIFSPQRHILCELSLIFSRKAY